MSFRMSLSNKTLVGMVAGAVVGFLVGPKIVAIQVVGDIFLRLLQMAIVPLIFCTVTGAIINMEDIRKLGRIGTKIFILFMSTTISAAAIGLLVARVIQPGKGLILTDLPPVKAIAEAPTATGILAGVIPTNIVQAMSEANLLQVIVFAIFSGAAILMLGESDRARMGEIFRILTNYIMKVLNIIIETSPYGVFALMAITAGKYGASVLGPLAQFIGSMYIGLILHLIVVLMGMYWLFTKRNPLTFFRKISPVWITSITTCSTKATMPVAMTTCEQELGLQKDIVGFTIPLGASTNMDGNALWYGVIAIFVSQLVGIELTLSQQVTAVLLGVLMTLGSPGIPGGIFVATTIFLKTLGLPLEVIGLLAGIFRIIDMGQTTINVLGTVTVTAVMGHMEKNRVRGVALAK
ncbi:MAG: dicarboxylate/amino acid:cation symporter [Desulfobacteraceae bacterium]|nr:dicarboxylate/amino acid:cation symporter [Desulfobacteraceae bacterium]